MTNVNFSILCAKRISDDAQLIERQEILKYWQNFYQDAALLSDMEQLTQNFSAQDWQTFTEQWQNIDNPNDDLALTTWLIALFNKLFNQENLEQIPTVLARGASEPEYFPSQDGQPARIEFAHGFFASCLHEISHWCVAGKQRRTLNDFGYWYEADGRNEDKQKLFEQVEIKPQAIECLLNQACGRFFYVSQDNLNADFDTSNSTFATDVYMQALNYLHNPQTLPKDAKRLIWTFLRICQNYSAHN